MESSVSGSGVLKWCCVNGRCDGRNFSKIMEGVVERAEGGCN